MKKFESMRVADNERLIRDLEVLTWENQFVKDEMKKACDERDYFKSEAENYGGERHHLVQSIWAVEIDKEDI